MAYNRIVLNGTLAGGLERFSIGMNFAPVVGPPVVQPADLSFWAEECVNGFANGLFPNLKAGLSSSGAITGAKAYYYAANNGQASTVGESDATATGTGGSIHPLPTSFVISLRTALSGRRYRGRMYWPALGTSITSAGYLTTTFTAAAPTEAKNFILACAAAPGLATDLEPVVVSKVGNVVTPVTSVAIGNVPDTQRRRRNDLPETYSVASV